MSLLCWWPLNGDLHNQGLSNSVDGTFSGTASYPAGKIGKCIECKRSSYVSLPYTCETTSNYTIAMWIKIPSTMNSATAWEQAFIYSNTGGGGANWASYHNLKIYDDSNHQYQWLAPGTEFNYDQWFHLTLVHKDNNGGNTTQFYINGSLYATNNSTSALQIKSGNFVLGAGISASIFFNDLRIYSHCLSPKEVQEIAKGLVLHYKLADPYLETTTNLGNTSSTYSNMTLGTIYSATGWGGDTGTVTYYQSGGYCGGPYKVYHKTATGSGGIYRKTKNDITIVAGKTYTMSVYVKASREFTDSPYSFNINGVTNSNSNYYITYGQSIHFTTEWQRLVKTFTATSANAGTFGEMSIVYNDDVADYYIYYSCFQIEEKDHATPYTNNKRPNTPNLVNGLQAGGRTTVNGNNIVTTGENADTYFYLKLSQAMILNHRYKLSCFASGITAEQGFTFPVASQSNTTPGQLSIKNGYNELIFIANAQCVNVGTSVILDDTSRPSTPTVCTFSEFCLQDLTEDIIDSSGYGYNGSAYGKIDYQSTTPKYSGSIVITDTTSHIVTPTIQTGGFQNTYTIAWWSKCLNWSGKMQWGSANGNRLNGVYSCYWNTSDGSSNPIYKPGTTTAISEPTRNVWHHLAMTGNGSKCYLYVDGILYGEAKTYKGLTGTQFYINGWTNSSDYCYNDLSVSDFRIYSTALSAAAVKDLYDTSAEIDNKGNLFVREVIEK